MITFAGGWLFILDSTSLFLLHEMRHGRLSVMSQATLSCVNKIKNTCLYQPHQHNYTKQVSTPHSSSTIGQVCRATMLTSAWHKTLKHEKLPGSFPV